ncbi:MAG: hypothetical protein ABI268_09210 [Rhodanobacter sp.]
MVAKFGSSTAIVWRHERAKALKRQLVQPFKVSHDSKFVEKLGDNVPKPFIRTQSARDIL